MNTGETFYEEEVSVEEYDEVLEDSGEPSFLTRAGQWLLVAFSFLFPIFVLPTTVAPVEMNKVYLAAIMSLTVLICWLGGALQEGRLRVVRSWTFYIYSAFLFVWFLAALFSQSPYLSFVGAGSESNTFALFLIGGVFMLVAPALFSDRAWVYRAIGAILASYVFVLIFFVLRSIFNISLASWADARGINLVGGWSMIGSFVAIIVAMLIALLEVPRKRARILLGALLVVGVITLAITNFTLGLFGLGLATLVLIALLLSQRRSRSTLFGVALGLLLIITLMALMRNALAEVAAKYGAPVEAIPGWSATFDLVEKGLEKSFLFGYGPNTFSLLWDQHRPAEFNATPIWSFRFSAGSAFVPTLFAEGGLLGGGLFILFVVVLLGLLLRGLSLRDIDPFDAMLLRSLFGGITVTFFLLFTHPVNATLVVLAFFLVGLFLAASGMVGLLPERTINLFSSTERGFVASLALILFLIASVVGIYYEATRYMGQVVFAQGIAEFNEGKGLNTAKNTLGRATQYDARQDIFWRSLAQLEVANLQRIINTKDAPQQELQERFQLALASAIEYANRAKDANPGDASNWNALGQVYETVIFMPGSLDFALEYYGKAKDLAPTNPAILLNIARSHVGFANATLLRGNTEENRRIALMEQSKAIDVLNEATALKSDFAEAQFLLAQLYQQQGKTDEAIRRAEATYNLRPNDIGVIFQLGVLYYQKGDFVNAKLAFERALELNENYSNALYFLGLIADRDGKREDAITWFRKIQELNPDNAEVRQILTNLEGGKPALEGLTAAAPEDRTTPPVSEEDKKIPVR